MKCPDPVSKTTSEAELCHASQPRGSEPLRRGQAYKDGPEVCRLIPRCSTEKKRSQFAEAHHRPVVPENRHILLVQDNLHLSRRCLEF